MEKQGMDFSLLLPRSSLSKSLNLAGPHLTTLTACPAAKVLLQIKSEQTGEGTLVNVFDRSWFLYDNHSSRILWELPIELQLHALKIMASAENGRVDTVWEGEDGMN